MGTLSLVHGFSMVSSKAQVSAGYGDEVEISLQAPHTPTGAGSEVNDGNYSAEVGGQGI